jgi:integrase
MTRIDSKAARDKLEFLNEPYWQRIAMGLFVGYRVSGIGGEGSWRGRCRDDGKQHYLTIRPDEFTHDRIGADTKFRQAEKIVREWHKSIEQGVVVQRLTVGEALLKYMQSKTMLPLEQIRSSKHKDLSRDDRNIKKNLNVYERLVINNDIGRVYLDKLRSDMLTDWLRSLVEDVDPMAAEELRAAKNTANRTWAGFRAALNWAFATHLVATDNAWRSVKRFKDVEASREFIPAPSDIAALYAKASPEIIRVCEFLRLTGCRAGEAYLATVDSFDGSALTIHADTKTGRRVVPLSTEASKFIAGLAVGKIKKAPLLVRDDGEPWETAELNKRFRVAREAAGYSFEFIPYSFRHLWITNACRGSQLNVVEVAQIAGTSVEMIQTHYAKLQHGRVTAALDNLASIRTKEQVNG